MRGRNRFAAGVFLLALGLLFGCSSRAVAGKNANGAMIVHTNDTIVYTQSGQYCGPDFDDPGTCEAAETRTDKDEASPAVVWLLAAFDEESNPGVSVVYFGITHNLPPGLGYFADWASCGPANTIEVPDSGWPETGRGNSVAFGSPILADRLFPFYWFAAYGFANAYLGTGINPTGGYAGFVDDGVPGVLDECYRFGKVRWYAAGSNDCPIASSCEIAVVSPNGGENWEQGTLRTIVWNSTDCDSTVRIDLLRNDLPCQSIASDAPNSGSYSWIAQQCNSNPNGYTIRVADLLSGSLDASNESFTIPAGLCQIDVTEPSGGAILDAGTPHEIVWGSGGACGSEVRIELVLDGEICQTLAESTPNDGSHLWTPERCGADRCGYKIRITDLSTGLADECDGTFCIRQCDLAVTSPNGGEVWDRGSEYEITWDSQDCGETVQIDLVLDDAVCTTIIGSTPNDGTYSWTAEPCNGAREGYKIQVTDTDSGRSDRSDQTFTIEGCTLAVTSPNGGEAWISGSEQTILWDSSDCGETVQIELLHETGLCRTISSGTTNDGSYSWTVEGCDGDTAGYTVRVTDLLTGRSDDSDTSFSIPICGLTVTSPNGGDLWTAGEVVTIDWESSGCGDTVRIDLIHGGTVCLTIEESTPNDGSDPWTVESCGGDPTGYRIRVTDLASSGSDESDQEFCIGCGTGTLYFDGDLELAQGQQGAELLLYGANSVPIRAYSASFCFDPEVFECVSISLEGTRGEGALGFDPDCGSDCVRADVLYSASCPPQIDGGDGILLRVTVNVRDDAPLGPTALDLVDAGPDSNTMTPCAGPTISPILMDGTIEIVRASFRRGDDDASGRIDILDPIYCLAYQYAEGPAPPCMDAGDFDDSGRYDISDCIANLCYQFGDCSEPPPPFGSCGPDPTPSDTLGCTSFPPCGTGDAQPARRTSVDGTEGSSIRLGLPEAAHGDTLLVPVELLSRQELVGLQFTVQFDPTAVEFLDLLAGEPAPDFHAARPSAPAGRIIVGIVPDLHLSRPLPPGRRGLGMLRVRILPSIEEGSRLEVTEALGVTSDRSPVSLSGEGTELGGGSTSELNRPRIYLQNPFRPDGSLTLDLVEDSFVRIVIYDVQGQKVRTLWQGTLPHGQRRLRWDGRSDSGLAVVSGVYYIDAVIGGARFQRTLTLVR